MTFTQSQSLRQRLAFFYGGIAFLLLLGAFDLWPDTHSVAPVPTADASVFGRTPTENSGRSTVTSTRDVIGNTANGSMDYWAGLRAAGPDRTLTTEVTFKFMTLTSGTWTGLEFYHIADGRYASLTSAGWMGTGITYDDVPGSVANVTSFLTAAPGDESGHYLTSLATLTLDNTPDAPVSFSGGRLLGEPGNDSTGFWSPALHRTGTAEIEQPTFNENIGGYQVPPTEIYASPVPEPSPVALAGLAIGLVGVARRHHTARKAQRPCALPVR